MNRVLYEWGEGGKGERRGGGRGGEGEGGGEGERMGKGEGPEATGIILAFSLITKSKVLFGFSN